MKLTYSVVGVGAKGDKGDNGRSLESLINYYKYTNSDSSYGSMPSFNGDTQTMTTTNGWSTSVPTYDSNTPYLWNFERSVYANPTSAISTTPIRINGVDGDKGDPGRGISSIVEQYYLSTSSTETIGDTWSPTVKVPTNSAQYLWNREYITYDSGDPATTTGRVVSRYINPITNVSNMYLASSNNTGITINTPGWSTSIPSDYNKNKQYLWNYEIVYGENDSTISQTKPAIIGVYGEIGRDGVTITSIHEYYKIT